MGVRVELLKDDGGIVKVELGAGEFLSAKDFKKLVSAVKEMDDAEFDPALKVWSAPFNRDNLACLELYLTNSEVKELRSQL